MDFSELKRKKSDLQNKLKEKVENLNSAGSFKDDRVWKLTTDKSGNGNAIIRFLMAPANEDFPFVRFWHHSFKGPGGWYMQNCLTTLGKNCPVCEANTVLWNTEIEANKKIASERKRKLTYVSNILVLSDPANKDNNGTVFLFKYGAKIFEKINDLLHPTIEGEQEISVFDFWDGCNFKIRSAKVKEYINYDKSQFESPAPLFGGDDSKIKEVWSKEYPLAPFVDPKEFKTYEELKENFDRVVGNIAGKKVSKTAEEANDEPAPSPSKTRRARPEPAAAVAVAEEDTPPFEADEDDAEAILKRFQSMADED